MNKEIPIKQATDLPEPFFVALVRWREEAERILHSDEIKWYAKLVSTTFVYNGKMYRIDPEDVFSPASMKEYADKNLENVLHAGFEILQKCITHDLYELGADNVRNWGFLD